MNKEKEYIIIDNLLNAAIFFIIVCYFLIPALVISQQRADEVLRIGDLASRVQCLNPFEEGTYEEEYVKQIIFGKSLSFYNLQTDLIDIGIINSYTANHDSTQWQVSIKEGIVFHDGTALNAEDIVFSITLFKEYIDRIQPPYNVQIDWINTIEALGPIDLLITLARKISDLPYLLNGIQIISQSYYQGINIEETLYNLEEMTPFGYGPFSVSRIAPGNRISLVRHSDYYKGPPAIPQIDILLFQQSSQLTSGLMLEELDVIPVHQIRYKKDIARERSSGPRFVLVNQKVPYRLMTFIDYNLSNEILVSENIRSSLAMLYERYDYVQSSFQFDVRQEARGPVPEDSWAYFDNYPRAIRNPERAVQLLEDEGWRDADNDRIREKSNVHLTLTTLYPANEEYYEYLVRKLKSNLGEIGIEIRETALNKDDLRERIRNKNYQLAISNSRYYPYDLIKTFMNALDIYGDEIHRNIPGENADQALRQFIRTTLAPNQRQMLETFRQLQYLMEQAVTSTYFAGQHQRIIAFNESRIGNFLQDNKISDVENWILKR
ncbi:ABC transporter substrate-binding protein [candidate division KSB1 bacterium]